MLIQFCITAALSLLRKLVENCSLVFVDGKWLFIVVQILKIVALKITIKSFVEVAMILAFKYITKHFEILFLNEKPWKLKKSRRLVIQTGTWCPKIKVDFSLMGSICEHCRVR